MCAILVCGEMDLSLQGYERFCRGDLGVRRIGVGGSLARTAWAGFIRAAKELPSRAPSPNSPRVIPAAS